jgi:hypothetical protein
MSKEQRIAELQARLASLKRQLEQVRYDTTNVAKSVTTRKRRAEALLPDQKRLLVDKKAKLNPLVNPSSVARRLSPPFNKCLQTLQKLMSQRRSHWFNTPVDPIKLKLPDYFNVIAKPMDLGTIQEQLLANQYDSVEQFAADVRLVWSNALLYNRHGDAVWCKAKEYSALFEELLKRWFVPCSSTKIPSGKKALSMIAGQKEVMSSKPSCLPDSSSVVTQSYEMGMETTICPPVKKAANFKEKQQLKKDILCLPSDKLRELVQILRDCKACFGGASIDDESIEVDIETMDPNTFHKLRVFVDGVIEEKTGVPGHESVNS